MAAERKERIIRVYQLLQDTDEKTPINASQIIERLDDKYAIGKAHRESIYNDIELLRKCGYDIQAAPDKRKGWYLKNHPFDDWELKIMLDAFSQAIFISEEETGKRRKKLLDMTSRRGRDRLLGLMEEASDQRTTDQRTGEYIENMLEALHTHKKIRFQYTEVNESMEKVLRKNGEYYTLNLYMICWSNNTYYLIGTHDHHENLANYRLDRILNLTVTDEDELPAQDRFGPNADQQIRDFAEKSVNHYYGEMINLTLEFTPDQRTNQILYDFAGPSVKVMKLDNGRCRASFPKMSSPTLEGWCLQFGNRFEVIAPQEFRVKLSERVRGLGEMYGK